MHVTLEDVAKLAQVSPKTVSRVVNNQGEISQETRQRVQAAIEQLGYQPNFLARSLVSRRSNTLAVVAWGLEYYGGPLRSVVGIQRQSDELGYSLLLQLVRHPSDMDFNAVLGMLVARRVDGIVWAIPEIGDNRLWFESERLTQLPPMVFLSMRPRSDLSVVAVNNRLGATQATQHLLDLGRRKIGLITGPLEWWEARERRDGWRDTLTQAGLEPSPVWMVEGDWSPASGERGLEVLLSRRPDLDAVFVSNDQMALGVLRVAHKLGRRVPQDLAVVGFDNIPESGFFCPPLTTVYQQMTQVGCAAVGQLHKIIQARQHGSTAVDPVTIMLATELIIRASSVGVDT